MSHVKQQQEEEECPWFDCVRCRNSKFSLCGSSELTSGRFLEVGLNKP